MDNERDLYAVLGLEKTATEDEVRRRYRKLAREHHPDVNPGKPEAEEKFKVLSAAYDVLSSKDKRALYDEFGAEGLRGGFDPEQARSYRRWSDSRDAGRRATGSHDDGVPYDFDLSDLIGKKTSAPQRSWPVDGEDIVGAVELDLGTALRGTEVELRVPTRVPCEPCAGTGARPGSQPQTCPSCQGAGRAEVMRGPLRMTTTCPRCGGSGSFTDPCETCTGRGYVTGEQTVRVRIPAGASDGDELRVRGQGTPGLFGGAPGDVLIRTHVKPHPWFERTGLDLRVKLPITLVEAKLGASIPVPTPTGVVQMKVPPNTQQGTPLRLKGRGVQRGQERGDLYVVLDVRLPDNDDSALSELLAQVKPFYTTDVREGVTL